MAPDRYYVWKFRIFPKCFLQGFGEEDVKWPDLSYTCNERKKKLGELMKWAPQMEPVST